MKIWEYGWNYIVKLFTFSLKVNLHLYLNCCAMQKHHPETYTTNETILFGVYFELQAGFRFEVQETFAR